MMEFNTGLFRNLFKAEPQKKPQEKLPFTPAEIVRKRHLDKVKSKTRAANKHEAHQRRAQRKAL